MAQPYIRFFGVDWRSDPCLRLCQAASRGVWADMLTIMMESEPVGHFLVNGKKPSPGVFGALTNTPTKVVEKALAELEKNGVFSRTETGVIYSRRMVRDAKRSEEAKVNGRDGGNPALLKGRKASGHGDRRLTPNTSGEGLPHPATPNGNGLGRKDIPVGSTQDDGEGFE